MSDYERNPILSEKIKFTIENLAVPGSEQLVFRFSELSQNLIVNQHLSGSVDLAASHGLATGGELDVQLVSCVLAEETDISAAASDSARSKFVRQEDTAHLLEKVGNLKFTGARLDVITDDGDSVLGHGLKVEPAGGDVDGRETSIGAKALGQMGLAFGCVFINSGGDERANVDFALS